MAESAGAINQQSIDISVAQQDSSTWSLGCDIIIEDIDMSVQEIKVDDIALSGSVVIEGVSVDIDSERANIMDLDVNVVIDGISSSIVESQVVSYDKILKINDLSPESVNESIYAASARSAKKIHDFISSVDNKAGQLEFNAERISSRVEALEKAMAEGGGSGGGGGEGFSYWVLEDGKLYSNYDIHVRGNAVIEGDTSSSGTGQDTPAAGGSLSNLSDVSLGYLSEGDVLVYDKDNGVWYNVPQSEIIPKLEGYAKESWVQSNFLESDALETYKEELHQEVKTISDLLASMWRIEGDNLVTDKQVVIKNNLIVEQDTSSGGEGESVLVGVQGISVNGGAVVYPNSEGIVELTIQGGGGGGGTADLSNYYTKGESDARYLALNGSGQVVGSTDTPLYLKSAVSDSYIGFKNSSESILGYYGFRGTTPIVYSGMSSSYYLIHSGNVGSYAMKWMGNAGNRDLNSFSYDAGVFGSFYSPNAPSGLVAYAVLNLPYRRSAEKPDFMAQILIPNGDDADTNMYYRTSLADSWNPWRKVISTADDGYVYGLGGYIDIQYSDEINRYGGNIFIQHRGNASGVGTGGNTTGNVIMCANGGNVGIGTSSPAYKLDVNGDISAMSALRIGGCGTSYCGLYPNNQITSSGESSKLWLYNESGLVFYGTSLEMLNHLDVVGNVSARGYIEGSFTRNSCMSSNMYFTSTQWLRVWRGPYGSAVRLQIGKYFYHLEPMVLCVDVSVGYSSAAISVTCNTDAANMSIQAIRVTKDASGNYNIDVLIYNYAVDTDTFRVCGNSELGHILAFETADNSATVLEQISVVPNASIISNNLIVSGDTSTGSDIRFKDVIKNKTLKIEHIAKAPLFTFKWNDRDDDSVHLGSSAQYWANITPWLVKGEDFKTLDYSTLGVAMGISLAKKAVNHEERIKVLEMEIKRLKKEMIHG